MSTWLCRVSLLGIPNSWMSLEFLGCQVLTLSPQSHLNCVPRLVEVMTRGSSKNWPSPRLPAHVVLTCSRTRTQSHFYPGLSMASAGGTGEPANSYELGKAEFTGRLCKLSMAGYSGDCCPDSPDPTEKGSGPPLVPSYTLTLSPQYCRAGWLSPSPLTPKWRGTFSGITVAPRGTKMAKACPYHSHLELCHHELHSFVQ